MHPVPTPTHTIALRLHLTPQDVDILEKIRSAMGMPSIGAVAYRLMMWSAMDLAQAFRPFSRDDDWEDDDD